MFQRRFNPFWEMEKMMKAIANTIDSTSFDQTHNQFAPKVDIWEDDFNVHFEFELPGVKKEEIKISINDDRVLTVSGEKKLDQNMDGKTCCRMERRYGSFFRSFHLPEELNATKVKARYNNGILTVSIEKVQETEPKEKVVEIL